MQSSRFSPSIFHPVSNNTLGLEMRLSMTDFVHDLIAVTDHAPLHCRQIEDSRQRLIRTLTIHELNMGTYFLISNVIMMSSMKLSTL